MTPPIRADAECVWALEAELGECPLWSVQEGALYFVDIKRPALHRFGPGETRASFPMPAKVGRLAFLREGGMAGAFGDGVFRIDLATGARRLIVDPEPDQPGNRLNDGTCDRAGNFWTGSMDDAEADETGALYCIAPDGAIRRMDQGYGITNGPAFSPDGRIFYHTDSARRLIYAFDVEGDEIVRKRIFAELAGDEGYPDGSTVDGEGYLWSALWGGAGLLRFDPAGRRVGRLSLPTPHVTASAFGGPGLDVLYVTTARQGLSAPARAADRFAGGLFAVDVGVRGLAPYAFDWAG
jgi:sugar lactone lactonase YvrE